MDERKRALVVGINAYGGGIPSLGSAVRDAEAIARQLELAHGYDVELLRDAEATVSSIIGSLAEVVDAGLSEESSFVLYYAGHGIAADDSDGTGPQGFLLAHDAELTNQATWLGMNSLRDALDGLACRHLMMVLDCCYAGAFRWASTRSVGVVKRPLYRSQYERYREGVAWQVLTSASYDEEADDAAPVTPDRGGAASPEGHSPFALALIEGLSGNAADSSRGGMAADGVLTATELYQFIYEKVAVNDRQTPGIFPLKHDNKGEFVFLAPGVELNLEPDPPLDDGNNPWLGLDAHSVADQDLFFGREQATEELLARVEAGGLVALVGASGSGKSSLIRAGLLPSLDRSEWTVVEASVAGDPKERLSAAQRELAAAPAANRRLLVIDQFEQVFERPDDSSRAAVIGTVRTLLESEDCPTILIALRSDFEPRAAAELGGLWTEEARVRVPEFSPDDLRSVILGPAQAKAVFFEPASIIDDLVHEVARMPGAAPLLSATLADLYRRAQARRRESGTADRMLSADDYSAIGGLVGALHRRADDLFGQADDAGKSTTRRLLLRLVEQDTDGLKRRRVDREELRFGAEHEQLVGRTLDSFVAARLLVVGSDGEREYVEPAHDALVTTWDKQLEWLAQSGSQKVIRDAWVAADYWRTKDGKRKSSKFLWNHNPHLLELQRRGDDQELNALEHDFRHASSKRKTTVTRRLIAFGAFFIVGLMTASVVALIARAQAVEAEAEAVTEAKIATSRQIAAQALAESRDHPGLALLLAVGANTLDAQLVANGDIAEPLVETQSALLRTLETSPQLVAYLPVVAKPTAIASAVETAMLATGDVAGSVTLWNFETRERVDSIEVAGGAVTAIAFSGDGSMLVAGTEDGSFTMWNPDAGTRVDVAGKGASVTSVAFDDEAAHVAVAVLTPDVGEDVTIREAATGDVTGPALSGLWVQAMEFASAETLIVVDASIRYSCTVGGGCVEAERVDDFVPSLQLGAGPAEVGSSAFSVSANLGAATDLSGRTVYFGELSEGSPESWIELGPGFIEALEFSPDGKLLAAVHASTLTFWDTTTAAAEGVTLPGVEVGIDSTHVAFIAADGSRLATLAGGEVQLWDRDRQSRLGDTLAVSKVDFQMVSTIAEEFLSVASSPDGKLVAWLIDSPGGGHRQAADRVEREGESIAVLNRETGEISTIVADGLVLAFSEDGKLVTEIGEVFDPFNGLPIPGATVECADFGALERTSGGGLRRCAGGILVDADRFDEAVSGLDLGVATMSADGNRLAVFDPESRQVTIFTDDAAANVVIDLSTDAVGLDEVGEEEFNKLELTLSPDGSLLGVSSFAGADYTFWNVDSTSLLLTQPRRTIQGFAFSPNARLVVFDRRDGGIEIRSASDFSIVAVLNGDGETDTSVLHFLSDGSVLLEATVGGGLTLWDFEPGSWMRRACKVSGRTLTQDERLRLIPEQVEIDPCRSTEVSDG